MRHPSGVSDGDETQSIQVSFQLRPVNETWPPVPSERLWAQPLGDGRFRIASTPWFISDIAIGDIVAAATRNDEAIWATDRLEASGNVTIRVIPRKDGPLWGDPQAVVDGFVALGAVAQGINQHGILAFDIPASADLSAVKAFLVACAAQANWYFEEGCVSDAWTSA